MHLPTRYCPATGMRVAADSLSLYSGMLYAQLAGVCFIRGTRFALCVVVPVVTYSGGESSCSVVLSGSSVSSEVHLDTSVSALGATYITLTSQNKVVLQNRSNMPVKFAWKVRFYSAEVEVKVRGPTPSCVLNWLNWLPRAGPHGH